MPKGEYPVEYLANPNINKPIEEIYGDIDAYTNEFFEEDIEYHRHIDFFVALPPTIYEGKFLKGIFFSQAVEYLYELYPQLSELFLSMAYTMWGSYSGSTSADAYLTLYNNKHRSNWFRKTNPGRKDKLLIPLQDADFTNEYYMAPVFGVKKDIDVLCVARLQAIKNLPVIAMALKVYNQKYPEKIRMTLIVGKDFGDNLTNLATYEKETLRQIIAVLGDPDKYINIIPSISHDSLSQYYTRAKVCVLGSLFEGKNRVINEAMSCNTPVICFKDFNKYARGEEQAFPEGAGLYAPEFTAESLADTIHTVINNQSEFKPRYKYLQNNGRKNFLNTCIDGFPYYEKELPEYVQGQHYQNLWLDLAVQYNYQSSLEKFLYGGNFTASSHVSGLGYIDKAVKFYFERFG